MKFISLLCLLLVNSTILKVFSQTAFVPYNKDYYQLMDRYEIKSGEMSKYFHSSFRPYQRKDVAAFSQDMMKDSTLKLSSRDRFNFQYLANDNWEFIDTTLAESKKPFLKHFYQKQNALFYHSSKEFDVQVMPVLYLSGGKEIVNGKTNPDDMILNTRGAEIRGMIGRRIGFYSLLTDNQAMFPTYVMNRIDSTQAVPGETFYKVFPGASTKTYKYLFHGNGVDFFTARGYITFDVIKKIINVQFGHDKNYIGNGYRSLFLSDNSSPYLFGKVTTKVWKLNYTLLFAQLTGNTSTQGDILFPKKYM
ncbi:MAG TPA: hypothetical protein VK766_00305, partial [Cytophagaceae bacterium]|nr:hypothetical protein [Cytophagaceae bacterium]